MAEPLYSKSPYQFDGPLPSSTFTGYGQSFPNALPTSMIQDPNSNIKNQDPSVHELLGRNQNLQNELSRLISANNTIHPMNDGLRTPGSPNRFPSMDLRNNDPESENARLHQEVKNWRDKYNTLESTLESKIRNAIESKMRDLKNPEEVRIYQAQLMDAQDTIRNLRDENNQLKHALSMQAGAQDLIPALRRDNLELAQKLKEATAQNDNANQNKQALAGLQQRLADAEARAHDSDLLRIENERLRHIIKEKDDFIMNNSKPTQDPALQGQLASLQAQLAQVINDNHNLAQENQKKDQQIGALLRENQDLKILGGNAQQEAQQYIEHTMNELEQRYRARLDKDRSDLDQRVATLTDQISQLANANAQLNTANSNLTTTIAHQAQEIQALKDRQMSDRAAADQNMIQMIKELETKNSALNNNVALLTNELNQLRGKSGDSDKLLTALKEAELAYVLNCIEIERLYLINSEFLEDINKLDETNQRLLQQLNEGDSENLRKIIVGLQQEIGILQNRTTTLMAENTKLTDLAYERAREIDNLRAQYAHGLSPTNDLELNELTSKFEQEKNNLDNHIIQLQAVLQQKQDENALLKRNLDQKNQELANLKNQIQSNPSNPQRVAQLETELHLREEQYRQLRKELDQMRANRDLLNDELQKERSKNFDQLNHLVSTISPSKQPLSHSAYPVSNHNLTVTPYNYSQVPSNKNPIPLSPSAHDSNFNLKPKNNYPNHDEALSQYSQPRSQAQAPAGNQYQPLKSDRNPYPVYQPNDDPYKDYQQTLMSTKDK